jgi:hypothetical protein
MRPEYEQAVNAVRWGWSLWIVFAIPSAIIWGASFSSLIWTQKRSFGIGCATFAIACFVFWLATILHGGHIQDTKKRLMQTEEERRDWSTDTWRVMAPFTAVPVAVVYCALNSAVAGIFHAIIVWLLRIIGWTVYNRDTISPEEMDRDPIELRE